MKTTSKKLVNSFTVTPEMQKRLKEYRNENGINISWLINTLLNEYFDKVGENRNGK